MIIFTILNPASAENTYRPWSCRSVQLSYYGYVTAFLQSKPMQLSMEGLWFASKAPVSRQGTSGRSNLREKTIQKYPVCEKAVTQVY